MPREYARIRLSLAEDDDFEDLTAAAQWLYLRVLLPEPSLNYAGVCDWRPNRLTVKAKGIDLNYILTAAAELEQKRYVLFDVETQEALVRSYIRGDELLRNPKMALAVIGGYQSTASKVLRAFIVTEVARAKDEHPEYSCWEHEISKDDVARLLTRKGSDSVTYTNRITNRITNQITNQNGCHDYQSGYQSDYQSDSVGIPFTYTYTYAPTPTPAPLVASQEDATPKTKRGQRIPENWRPTPATAAWAQERYGHLGREHLDLELEKFVNHWTAASGQNSRKMDWNRAFQNWLHNAKQPSANRSRAPTSDVRFAEIQSLKKPEQEELP